MEALDTETLSLIALGLYCVKRKRERKRLWTRSWLARRANRSVYYKLLRQESLEDPNAMRQWIRLSKVQYQELLQLVTPLIQKEDTNMRKAVTPGERLTLTLRYLATGETHSSLAHQFRISHNLISKIVPEVCRAIYKVLKPTYLKLPCNGEEWCQVASDFFYQWNFPMCVGVVGGRRVLTAKPQNSGWEYCDDKGHFSFIVMALVDADSKFMYADVGPYSRASDGGVWDRCSLKEGLEGNLLGIPEPDILPLSCQQCPYVILGDDAFPQKPYLMTPYPEHDLTEERNIFNYRLARARRTAENAFGVLAARFQILKSIINTSPTNAKDITLAAVALHNFLRTTSKETYSPLELLDREDEANGRLEQGEWHQHPHAALESLQPHPRGHTNTDTELRDSLKDYFINEGKVAWQDRMARLH